MMKLRSLILAGFLALPFASSFAQVGVGGLGLLLGPGRLGRSADNRLPLDTALVGLEERRVRV